MQDREVVEVLLDKAEAYVIALLREALVPNIDGSRSREVTVAARTKLFDMLEQLETEDKRRSIFG